MARRRHSGWPSRFPIVQFPNAPLWVALAASLAARATDGSGHRLSRSVFYVALSVWAYEEARHGDNWFRQALGVAFCAYVLASLTHALRS